MENKITYAEEIIQKIKQINQKEEDIYNIENDINNGFVVVKYKKLDIEEKELLDGAITMLMPKEFQIMEEELAEIKYPGEDKPDYIYTNEDTTVNITFTIEDSGEIDNEEIEEVKDILAKQMQRLHPASKIEDSQTIQTGEKNISFFSYDLPLIDGDIYNLMFFMELKGQLLMGTFNCSIYQKKQYKPIIQQILMTIKEPSNHLEEKTEEKGQKDR
ncbi:hypothetical protein SAMN05446037_101325 [Anaerovirgula multivorans]|uniref:Uncharacterized protein n=1 Tax=Anaerovirgula multivorans TaxID=312168 RepID=A0A239FI02_9FIRM|nr:hypothetical protein [Anaerovirgula multivorans]SNS56539.1 hypothetical protein SAMN05446037_101325 [Anaerovirgula multivorans]